MGAWIFQGNPDRFDMDTYLAAADEITWTVNQKGYEARMAPGHDVFIWRAAGRRGALPGVVAAGILIDRPSVRQEDSAAVPLWSTPDAVAPGLRVGIRLWKTGPGRSGVIKKDWMTEDPVLSDLVILRQAAGTNFPLSRAEASRLSDLVARTGEDWTTEESLAGLWAYSETKGGPVSKLPGSPVAEVALLVGRAVSSVYNKVLNFRALDPTDDRRGLPGYSNTDRKVWRLFFDAKERKLREEALQAAYQGLGSMSAELSKATVYAGFGPAPSNDPEELQRFAARVRRGQPRFRKGLIRLYGGCCCVTGHGPEEVLEAVHILNHADTGLNAWDNGLLLRSDLHYLLDRGLMWIHPKDLTVSFDETLQGTPYWDLQGTRLRKRKDGGRPSQEHLEASQNL